MKFVRVPKNQEINKQPSRTKKSKASPAEFSALAAMHMNLDTKKWAKSILQQNDRSGDDASIEKLMERCNEIWYVQQHRLETRIKRRIGRLAYSTRWRTRFHADGGQCSSVMADTVPR